MSHSRIVASDSDAAAAPSRYTKRANAARRQTRPFRRYADEAGRSLLPMLQAGSSATARVAVREEGSRQKIGMLC